MALLNMSMKNDFFSTPIPNSFIDHYMLKAHAVYVTIYIFAFRHCFHNNTSLNTKDIAKALNIIESDVTNAWEYWQNEGLIQLHTTNENNISIEFLPIHHLNQSNFANIDNNQIANTSPEPTEEDKILVIKEKKKFVLETRPEYSAQELEIYQTQSPEINYLFNYAQQSLGKTLKYADLNLLFSLYDWLRLPLIVIEKLLSYCSENGHTNMNYIEAVAIDWAEKGIDSIEAADDYIQTFNKDFKEILKAFGQSNRKPTPKESEILEKWLKTYKMPLPVLLEACDKTIMSVGKMNLKYTDKIVTNWFENNVKTVDEVKKLDDEFYKNELIKQGSDKPSAKKTASLAPKKNRFVNFEGRTIDYNQLEKMEQEYINNKVGEQK